MIAANAPKKVVTTAPKKCTYSYIGQCNRFGKRAQKTIGAEDLLPATVTVTVTETACPATAASVVEIERPG